MMECNDLMADFDPNDDSAIIQVPIENDHATDTTKLTDLFTFKR